MINTTDLPPLEPVKVKYADEPALPKQTGMLQSTSMKLMDLFKGNVYPMACVLSLIWGYRSLKSMNMVLASNYSDIVYQIRRPDIIANRISAFKYLVVGGTIVPCAVGGMYFGLKYYYAQTSTEMPNPVVDGVRVIPVTSEATQDAVNRLTARVRNGLDQLAPEGEGNAIKALTLFVRNVADLVKTSTK